MTSTFETLTAIAAVATLPLAVLAGVFAGWQEGLLVVVVGWFLLVPVFGVLSGHGTASDVRELERLLEVAERADGRDGGSESRDEGSESREDPLETLRERYARGELDDVEFERALETLVETETEDPERVLERRRSQGSERTGNRTPTPNREPEVER